MRSVRFVAIAVGLAVVLTACGANDSSSSSPTGATGEGTAAAAPEDDTTLEAPQPPADKWSAAGDVCRPMPVT